MSKVKDWTTLEAYAGMKWDRAAKKLRGSMHMFAFSKDPETVEAGMEIERTWRETGEEAGMAAFLAHLVRRKNGEAGLAGKAISMYKEVAEALLARPGLTAEGKKRVQLLKHRVEKMEEMASWASVFTALAFKWPIEPPFLDDVQKKSGLANVMLFVAAREMEDRSGSDMLAACGIVKFLKEGLGHGEEG